MNWLSECMRILKQDGLCFIFGQLGKREHVWLHFCSQATRLMQFHDMVIWDRAVGYNERGDSFTPQYEMILVLRQPTCARPYFNKDAVRIPYDEETIRKYLRDPRYKDLAARGTHLRKGKFATNIMRVPSLKGASKEKEGHPSQKPVSLILNLMRASTQPGDLVVDPFLGSGTTAVAAKQLGRRCVGIELDASYVAIAQNRLQRVVSDSNREESPLFPPENLE